MSLETLRQEMQKQLSALETQASALRGAISALGSDAPAPSPAPPAPPARTRASAHTPRKRGPGRPSGGGPTRTDQALALVRERPGIKITELANTMGIEPNYLYRIMPKLKGNGAVVQDAEGGWKAVA